ncbi:MAG: glycosyltransferase family 2 protein [Lachnospiraceae bacterium]|nr:glycosyltransferase family 2 protein [Candidatus Merdinaster equi]
MLETVKKIIQDNRIKKAELRLEKDTAYCKDRYLGWIRDVEPGLIGDYLTDAGKASYAIYDVHAGSNPQTTEDAHGLNATGGMAEPEYIIITEDSQAVDKRAKSVFGRGFSANSSWEIAYTDEDYSYEGTRVAPFMKPDFSPDTLMAYPYFGSLIAVRIGRMSELAASIIGIGTLAAGDVVIAEKKKIYSFLLQATALLLQDGKESLKKIGHIPLVMYHVPISEAELNDYRELEKESYSIKEPREITADENLPWYERLYGEIIQREYDDIRIEAVQKMGFTAAIEQDAHGTRQLMFSSGDASCPLVSIVIPSKDNEEVLIRLLDSIKNKTEYNNYEVIVVDNGSSGHVRTILMGYASSWDRMTYVYEPMDFNFSKMVNLGARKAKGDYVLLLNDDTEVLDGNWLSTMTMQAMLPHVGCVGAKLLYPDSDLIQHAGVTNLAVGPAHKIQMKSDSVSYYYGKNRMVHDYVGVTAACLLVSKKIYEEVGGFDEEIKVAFNDVDFCFSVIEKGYYNVMRPDVVLTHYESLSRGDDRKSEEKTRRMLAERDRLYEKHGWLWGKDPYYSPNLMGNAVDYLINFRYEYEKETYRTPFRPFTEEIKPEWYNDSIYITIEKNELAAVLEQRDMNRVHHISGWAYVLNQNNARYLIAVMLKCPDGEMLIADTDRHWRPDVVQILPDQVNVQMSGFLARCDEGSLPPGEYGIFIYMKDTCSRQRLLKDSGQILKVE